MGRGPRSVRSPMYNSGGGGGSSDGGLMGLIGSLVGVPGIEGGDMLGGEEMAAMGGPESVIGASGPERTPLKVEKPGFWQNLLTKGGAGMQYQNLNNQLKMQQFGADKAMALQNLRNSGTMNALKYKEQEEAIQREIESQDAWAKMVAEQQGKGELQTQGEKAALELARNKAAFDFGVPKIEQFEALGSTPDYLTELYKSKLSGFQKPALDNQKLTADVAKTQAETEGIRMANPTKAFMDIREGNAMVDPVTGRVIANIAPQKEAPEVKGGTVGYNLPAYSGGSFAKVPGGVNSEFGAPPPAAPGQVPPYLARPGLQMGAINQASITPPKLSLSTPQFNTQQFQEDFGPLIEPLMKIPLIEDFIKKRGMFQQKQQFPSPY